MTLTVNGQQRRVDVMKQETLAMTLRYKLGLTGTKLGCDRSECGACTVLIDDVPHYSCSVLTHTVRNKQVVTVEGLESRTASCIRCSRRSSTSRASSARSACPGS
jgi:aerobic-type carbon monoxide dehydrogenase small subunit (CoxS/CutS family)